MLSMYERSLLFEIILEIEKAIRFNIDPERFYQIYADDISILKQAKN